MKVFVYYNLHKKCWSVRHKGKVIQHSEYVALRNATFKVSQAGRERVLREKRKNVHAGVEGELIETWESLYDDIYRHVTYNPYKYHTFVDAKLKTPIKYADYVMMRANDIFKVMALNPR